VICILDRILIDTTRGIILLQRKETQCAQRSANAAEREKFMLLYDRMHIIRTAFISQVHLLLLHSPLARANMQIKLR
jgi:hypothetical protein